jgi:hypothetical protein
MNVNHSAPSATLLLNGKVLIAGGDIGDGDGASFIAELYDPATGKFSTTGNLVTGREQNVTTLLPDGTVLFAGGHGGVPVPGGGWDNLASAEIYDPGRGAFRAVGAMLTGRDLLAATLLNNGQVLITGGNQYYPAGAGGRDPQQPVVSVAELYTPAVRIPAPALFSLGGDGRGQGAIWHAMTGEIASPTSPAVAGEVLSMYTTSLAERGVIPPRVAIGGRRAEVLYYGAAPEYPGYYQVNFRVPDGVAPGPAVPVRLNYLGRPSNEVTIGLVRTEAPDLQSRGCAPFATSRNHVEPKGLVKVSEFRIWAMENFYRPSRLTGQNRATRLARGPARTALRRGYYEPRR